MRISTKGRYAARAMVELATNFRERCVPASEIADHQGISLKYLESLLSTLKSAGLVRSKRGKNGGYSLARTPAEISLYDVLTCLEDSFDFVHCTQDVTQCERAEACVTREVWLELKVSSDRILKRTFLDGLADRRMILEAEKARFAHMAEGTDS